MDSGGEIDAAARGGGGAAVGDEFHRAGGVIARPIFPRGGLLNVPENFLDFDGFAAVAAVIFAEFLHDLNSRNFQNAVLARGKLSNVQKNSHAASSLSMRRKP